MRIQRRYDLRDQNVRRKLILSIIKNEKVHSQDELKALLKAAGVESTQATLSRDLKVLGIARVFHTGVGYIYTSTSSNETGGEIPDREDLLKSIKNVQFSGNLAVVKTKLGHATGVAFEIDHLEIPDVIGTVGGDDTILVVLREGADQGSFIRALRGELLRK